MECEAVGKPAPTAKWMKNGREITEHPGRVAMEEKDNGKGGRIFKIVVEEIWEIDEGEYTCQAWNNFGYSHTSARLKVNTISYLLDLITLILFNRSELLQELNTFLLKFICQKRTIPRSRSNGLEIFHSMLKFSKMENLSMKALASR